MVNLPPARTYWSREWAKQRTFSRFIALELIGRIHESDEEDPIRIIFSVYDWMDEILCGEEHGRMAWQFANSMKDAISEVLDLLA